MANRKLGKHSVCLTDYDGHHINDDGSGGGGAFGLFVALGISMLWCRFF